MNSLHSVLAAFELILDPLEDIVSHEDGDELLGSLNEFVERLDRDLIEIPELIKLSIAEWDEGLQLGGPLLVELIELDSEME